MDKPEGFLDLITIRFSQPEHEYREAGVLSFTVSERKAGPPARFLSLEYASFVHILCYRISHRPKAVN
jgi:hypothetical protein